MCIGLFCDGGVEIFGLVISFVNDLGFGFDFGGVIGGLVSIDQFICDNGVVCFIDVQIVSQ